jgi:hypothetical protein
VFAFTGLLRDGDVCSTRLFTGTQTRRLRRRRRKEADIIICRVKIFDPVTHSQELGGLDELEEEVSKMS